MALVTVQRSPSPSNTPESDDGVEGDHEGEGDDLDNSSLKSPGRQRRSTSAMKKLKKFFNTVRFISKLQPSFSESYFAVKGAVLILPQSDVTDHTYTQKIVRERHAGVGTVTGDIQSHLQSMFYLLRSHDTIKVAVKLESQHDGHNRYMAVVSCFGKQDTEESVILGIDCNKEASIGMVLPIWADTSVKLNGDGGFMVTSEGKQHIFKPVSVQAMWSALQSLNKVVKISRDNVYIPRGLTHTWVGYYNSRISSDRACISEWYTSEELLDWRASNVIFMDPGDSPDDVLQKQIKTELKNIMMTVDLDEVTSRFLREALEKKLKRCLMSHKKFLEQEMLTIMGQMDSPTMIKDFLYLGSEFNASNLEELTENGVDHILNISREVDNFFPEILHYMNIKEWDNEEADLCKHWDNTNKFIAKAKRKNSKVLVHCKMGISRSASTVMAYLMKEYDMTRQEAFDYVKVKRACVMPNQAFWQQLLIYQGILSASKQRALFKSKSEQNLICTVPVIEKDEEDFVKGSPMIRDDLCLPALPSHDLLHDSMFLQDKDKDIMFDLENSSRSADSTEESVDLPSPKAEGVEGGWKSTAYGVYVVESNKMSPGDGPDTDSSCLSDDDMDIGETDTDNLFLKLSELEKNQSLQAAATKFKPDHSWINERTETIDDPDTSDVCPEELDTPMANTESDIFPEMPQTSDEPPVSHTPPVLELPVDTTTPSDTQMEDKCSSPDDISDVEDKSTPVQEDIGVQYHYVKENIPWNPGTVKKQLLDIESKSKEVKAGEDTELGSDDDNKCEPTQADPIADSKPSEDSGILENVIHTPEDTKIATENSEDCQSGDDEKPILKRSASVYEIEDIPLPAGIVKKTTQEIEDRNNTSDSSPESPHRPLQRSSSLKEERSTPKRKRSERRKTCTPVLTPSSTPSSTPRSSHDTTPQCDTTEFVFPPTEATESADSRDTTLDISGISPLPSENNEESDDVAVYKYGSEEVPVAKGIVKKQKMDIEQKARDRQMSEGRTPDSDKEMDGVFVLSKVEITKDITGASIPIVPTTVDIPKVKDTGVPVTTEIPKVKDTGVSAATEIPNVMDMGMTAATDIPIVSDTGIRNEYFQKETVSIHEGVVKATVSKLSTSPVFNRDSQSPSSPLGKEKHKADVDLDDSGRFDSATLELIREIGSAFLNSPSKAEEETEVSEQEAMEGGSLVKFLVRNIEKHTTVTKKKHLKEIVIIDKETAAAQQEKKKKVWRFSNPGAEPSSAPVDHPRVTHSHSSPALDVPARPRDGSSPLGFSPAPSISPPPPRADPTQSSTADHLNTQSAVSVIDQSDTPDDSAESMVKEKVKDLVGRFEHSDNVKSPSAKAVTPTDDPLPMVLKELDSVKPKTTPGQPSTPHNMDTSDRLASVGASTFEIPSPSQGDHDNEGEQSVSEQSIQLRQLRQNLRKANNRPKSAEHIRRCNDTTGGGGASPQRPRLRHAHTLPTSCELGPSLFSWEGKKVRKLHGKSHPLSKLETRRKSPFYNTM